MNDIISFASAKEFKNWLAKNHTTSEGIWLRMFRKNSNTNSIKGSDALDAALCYGWITGQARPYDEISCLWRFCPRRPKSMWSKLNTEHAERLIKEKRMKPAGLKEINSAKQDGRWERAYSPQRTATLPKDFIKEINKNKKAKAFLKTLNRSSTYAIIFRIHNTKSKEHRAEKINSIIKMLEKGEKFH